MPKSNQTMINMWNVRSFIFIYLVLFWKSDRLLYIQYIVNLYVEPCVQKCFVLKLCYTSTLKYINNYK